jgi:hypothetical protein
MDAWVVVLIVLVVVAVLAFAFLQMRTRRSEALRGRFGPEYERAVAEKGDQRTAEKELRSREERREKLQIRKLEPETRERYLQRWKDTQARFVDEPRDAVVMADSLVISVMRDRGYPVENFEQRSADISVDHPAVVENYRAAHRISGANEQGQATTEDLRQAMVHYRVLFAELLETKEAPASEAGDLRVEERPAAEVEEVDLREERDPRTYR